MGDARAVTNVTRAAAVIVSILLVCCRTPERHFESGNRYSAQQKWKEAITEYRSAIEIDPLHGEAHYRLGEAYIEVDDRERAANEFLRAVDLLPDSNPIQLKTGAAMLWSRRFEDAKAHALTVLRRDPDNLEAQILLANATGGLKDLDSAVGDVQDAIWLDPTESRTYLNLAVLQVPGGNIVAAEETLRQVVDISPGSVQARLALSNLFWSTERLADAERTLQEAVAIEPANELVNRALAAFYLATNRAPEAEKYLQTIVETTHEPKAKLSLADYLQMTDRSADAIRILEPLAAAADSGSAARVRIAAIRYQEGKEASARQTIDEILAQDPQNVHALIVKSRFLTAEGRLDEAIARLRTAVSTRRHSAAAHFLLGNACAANKDRDGAIKAYTEVLKLNPRAFGVQLRMAELYLERGDAEAAVEFAEQAIRNMPTSLSAHLVLIGALLARGDVGQAETDVTPLLAMFPKVAQLHAFRGKILQAGAQTVPARQAFEQALALDPDNTDALEGLVGLDLSVRSVATARAALDARLSRTPRDVTVLRIAADAYRSIGDLARAEDLYIKAIAADPSDAGLCGRLVDVYLEQRRPDRALATAQDLARRQPASAPALTLLGIAFEAEHQLSAARDAYERALSVNPRASVAAMHLSALLLETGGNLDMALQYARVARATLTRTPAVDATLGRIFYKREMWSQAVAAFEDAVSKAPDDATLQYELGLSYLKRKDVARAKAALERALRLDPGFDGADNARKLLAGM